VIEVWLKERLAGVGSIKVGSGASSKVTTLASVSDGEILFSGSADGKIQVSISKLPIFIGAKNSVD